jgi:phosphatidylserine/phosphatidylglycerophosphate/cardiolipin synthase-like enzyme
VWLPIKVLADKPTKMTSEGTPDRSDTLADDIIRMVRGAKQELTVISPYFVPGERGVALIRELRERGVKVRVLTNSLATTDSPVVHIGYSRARPELLKAGVELYELRRQLEGEATARIGSYGDSEASLHAKALVIDHNTVLVGSMNMDPRSAWLNTEIGLVTQSPQLAGQLERLFDDVARSSAYRMELVDGDEMRWIPPEPGATGHEGKEPDASMGLRLMLMLLSPFAPDEML